MAETNSVVDLSHHNNVGSFSKAVGAGVIGVIYKASQGTTYSDPTYKSSRKKATEAGLLWGAYHFGTGSDGVHQAEHFLEAAQPTAETLLVLDFEDNPAGPSMDLEEARAFVTHLHSVTGKWPGFYSGHTIKRALNGKLDPVLANCWFWLAQYRPTPVLPTNWETWTLWQYTDGAAGDEPHQIPGIGRCDRDKFNGTEEELRQFWTSGEVVA